MDFFLIIQLKEAINTPFTDISICINYSKYQQKFGIRMGEVVSHHLHILEICPFGFYPILNIQQRIGAQDGSVSRAAYSQIRTYF